MNLTLLEKKQYVRDLREDLPVTSAFLIKHSALITGKNGKPYLNLVLIDRTGEIEARLFDRVEEQVNHAVRDAFVWVEGKLQLYQGRRQVLIKRVQALREDEIKPEDFIAESIHDANDLHQRLLEKVASMQDPHYRALCEAVVRDDAEIIEMLKRAPAAKSFHHAYRGGLLEHMVSVLGLLEATATHYGPTINRDLLLVGGIFHDICKIWELSYERTTDYTDEGRLIGHLVMGVELIERKVNELNASPDRLEDPFPQDKKLLAKHVVLAHHGQLEFGSPKRPKVLEAFIVHSMDDLDSKVNAIQSFIAQDQTPGSWTALHRNYGRYLHKGPSISSPLDL